MNDFYIIKILFFSFLAFVFTIAWTPLLTHFLYKYKFGKQIRNSGATPVFSEMHAHKAGTPTMGGVLVWISTFILGVVFFYLPDVFPWDFLNKLNFISRAQTILPLGVLVVTALVGLFDDWMDVRKKAGVGAGGLRISQRLSIYTFIALIGALWFYFKLDWDLFHVPFLGNFEIGWPYILIFMFVIVATAHSVNLTDGLDGLAGGVLLICYGAYAVISFALGKYDLAVFCGVISGALLAFLWFNINPARFFMGDTGSMSLGITLGVIAMLTNTALILPIIGFVFVLETFSVMIQMTSKRLRKGKKVFISSPIHHHLEAIGWSEPKIVMRLWVASGVSAVIGLVVFLLDKTF